MFRLWFAVFSAAALCSAQPDDPLKDLRPGHPRLVVLAGDLERIRSLVRNDPYAKDLYLKLVQAANKLEKTPPVEYPGKGQRVLEQSRACLDRIYTLALLYRLDAKKQYLDRALRELHAAAAFPDWNPNAFLDVSEMIHAFAIGYDWLYPALSPGDRALLRQSILQKGIRVGLKQYENEKTWTVAPFNSNQVGNAGISIGALAIADEEPELARTVLRKALASIRLPMAEFAPDGGWKEGPMYWHYAVRYTVWGIAALESALGTDFGLSSSPGFSRTGDFRIYSSGPVDKAFNFADAHEGTGRAPEMWWLARKFTQPVYAWHQKSILDEGAWPNAMDLIWYQPTVTGVKQAGWPLDKIFTGINVAFLRSAWEDRNAIFVGVKGGNNTSVHYHADAGTFVLDANGVRWAMDLGSDGYVKDYFDMEPGGARWKFYRTATESHNTLLIDGANQAPLAPAPLSMADDRVRIDLSKVNPSTVEHWERRVEMPDRKYVLIQDDLTAKRPVEVLWGMVTPAEVSCRGATAELKQRGHTLLARILSPDGAAFDTVSTQPPKPQNQNKGTRKLVIRLPGKIRDVSLRVELIPQR